MEHADGRTDITLAPDRGKIAAFGVPLESALARREKLADNYDIEFGQELVFLELVRTVLEEVPPDSAVLEVGAATGLMTRPLLERAGSLTALEPSAGLLRRLVATEVASSPKLRMVQGLVEDLPLEIAYNVAVVTFTPRRGVGLLRLLIELGMRVSDRIVMMLDDDSLDWAYIARSAASRGFDTSLRFAVDSDTGARAVVLTAAIVEGVTLLGTGDEWALDAREVTVPYPQPRGVASRLVRYLLSGGDRALLVRTDHEGVERLYGNLRTAVHRLGRNELTVRRDGDSITLVRLPRSGE